MASPSVDVYIDVPLTEPQPAIPPDIQPTDPANLQFQTTSTANHHWVTPTPPPADYRDPCAQRGENYGDSSGGLWTMYLSEAEKEDKEIAESWKADTDGILVCAGLFSATVAAFLIESYKKLSPDSGDTTNALLIHLSQQLVNISNGTPLTSVVAQGSQPFKPTASAVRVNMMWFLSLVLSLTSGLSAALVREWAQRYLKLVQHRGAPHKRARWRTYIFDGLKQFRMSRAIETIPTLLHLSILLFFAGLIDFLIPINTTVAYFTLGWIVLFAAAYAILTILPNLPLNCPYRTPLSGITWRSSQFSIQIIFLAVLSIEGLFHEHLLFLWHWTHQRAMRTPGPTKWRTTLEEQVAKRRKWLRDGLQRSFELSATSAPSTVVQHALEWTLTALNEDKDFEDFAERVPGFFDSKAVQDPTSAILPLMSDQPTTEPILGSRLRDLLETCISGISPLTKEKRIRRLRVCLKCLWYYARAYNQLEKPEPLPSYVRVVFADPEMTHRIQAEEDLATRVIGRCFGALVTKKLSSDIVSRDTPGVRVKVGEPACLLPILGTDGHEVVSLLDQPGAIELASIISLISSSADSLVGDTMPSDVLDVFKQTLRILLSETLPVEYPADLLRLQLAQFPNIYSNAPNWLKDVLQQISDRLPTGIVAFPEPQLAHESSWTHVSQQSRENQVRVQGAPDVGIASDGGLVHM